MTYNIKTHRFENYDFTVLNNFKQYLFFLKKIPIFFGMFLKRKILHSNIRTKEVVDKSYNQSTWKTVLETKSWENKHSLSDFLNSNIENNVESDINFKCILLMNSRLYQTSVLNRKKLHTQLITELIKKYTKNSDEIVEIGCGYGLNLFSLVSQGLENSMSGCDISPNSITTGKKINDTFNCNVKFDIVDITKNLNSMDLKDKTVISFHSFEQIKYYTDDVINDLIDAKVSQVIHFEPISELYGITARDISSFLYIKARDYQDNLLHTLKNFEKIGKLKILENYRLGYAENPFHETSLTRWVPT
jgi:hypothetical protein